MAHLTSALQRLTSSCSTAVVITNEARIDDDIPATPANPTPMRPALGLSWTYAASIRLQFSAIDDAIDDGIRSATLLKHPNRPTPETAYFQLASCGVCDCPEPEDTGSGDPASAPHLS